MRYLLSFLFFLFFSSNVSLAQKASFFEKKGKEAFTEGNYYGAAQYFKKALSIDSSSIDLQYLCADACRLNLEYNKAITYYKLVFKTDRGQKYPLTPFWLGTLYKNIGNYKEAIKQFDRYAKKFKKKNTYHSQKAKQELASCNFALQLIKDTGELKIIHLDSVINTVAAEFSAVEWKDTLYYSSLQPSLADKKKVAKTKLYFTNLVNPQQRPEQLDTILNSEGTHSGNICFSSDGTQLFFSRCKQINFSNFECKIVTSKRNADGNWSKPEALPEVVNQINSSATQPHVAKIKNQDYLFFSSNRTGGYGGYDIWYVPLDFSKAASNLGKLVNSIEDEISPFYCSPCKQLYFSSPWHFGLGGFDIFKSNYNDTVFLAPNNLGLPFNSSYNDLYFTINKQQTTAYLSSNRLGSFFEKNETCCNDIYKIKLNNEFVKSDSIPEEITNNNKTSSTKLDSALLRINKLRELVPLTLFFHNDEPDSRTKNSTTTKNYQETFFQYVALKSSYKKEYAKNLNGKERLKALNDIDVFFEDSVEYGFEQLEKFATYLTETLNKGDTVIVTMQGYCSPLASSDYNIKLAKRRVSSLVNYFNQFDNGALQQYIAQTSKNGGVLLLQEVPVGELEFEHGVSDDLQDKRNSVYSPTAAADRKIQIIAVGFK